MAKEELQTITQKVNSLDKPYGLPKDDNGTMVMNAADSSKTKTKEDLVAERISKRGQRKAEVQARAEQHKRAGDTLFEAQSYKAAHVQYLEAIELMGNIPEYYICLAAAYRKLTWHEEAAHAATRALTIDPKNLEARYMRGVARLEQRLLQAAGTDFETVLEHDPTHLRALAAMAEVKQFFCLYGAPDPDNIVVDFAFPHWDYEALEVASVSDSSDCQHVGNGVPCRFYNHVGCARGAACAYSHAPDEKSVRDDLGKNVCIYHLLESCKFGHAKCVYSHSKDALPKRGWWNSPEKVAKVKAVLEVAEKNVREQRQLDAVRWRTHLKEMRDFVKSSPKSAGMNRKMGLKTKGRLAENEEEKKPNEKEEKKEGDSEVVQTNGAEKTIPPAPPSDRSTTKKTSKMKSNEAGSKQAPPPEGVKQKAHRITARKAVVQSTTAAGSGTGGVVSQPEESHPTKAEEGAVDEPKMTTDLEKTVGASDSVVDDV